MMEVYAEAKFIARITMALSIQRSGEIWCLQKGALPGVAVDKG